MLYTIVGIRNQGREQLEPRGVVTGGIVPAMLVRPMYRLPEYLRGALQTPVGDLVQTGDLPSRLEGADPLIGVGDVTALTLIDEGYRPKLILVDFRNERTTMPQDDPRRKRLSSYGDHSMNVNNPPAMITRELMGAIEKALGSEGTWRIEVDGEEDLAVLPCMTKSGDKAKIVYGMPGQGLVVVNNDVTMLTWAQAFLSRMDRI
jgi:uncharacterized protein (UPF0218 family)